MRGGSPEEYLHHFKEGAQVCSVKKDDYYADSFVVQIYKKKPLTDKPQKTTI